MSGDEPSRAELKRRIERLEQQVEVLTPSDVSRRRALQALAAGATGTAIGGGSFLAGQEAAVAQPDVNDSDPNIGDPSNTVDVFADGVELDQLKLRDTS